MTEWDATYISNLPDSAFACIDPGGEKDDEGKTVPRSLRHYPHHNEAGNLDLPHLRNALSRVAQEDTTSCGVSHLRDHAEEEDVGKGSGVPDRKAFTPFEFKLSETGDVLVAFSRFNVIDSDGDVTFVGSMPLGKAIPMSAYGHTSWDGALPTGKGTIGEKGDLGIFDGSFFMETDQGRNAYHTTKAMADLQEWSYGYNVIDGGPGTFDGKRVRELRKLDVFEVSPVLKGAGVGTGTLAIKSGRPEAGASYAEVLSWYAEGLSDLVDRTKDRSEFRAKEGRVLSSANLAMLEELASALEAHTLTVRDLILAANPPKRVDPVTMDILLGEARLLGIPV
jgi:hypothetical protein